MITGIGRCGTTFLVELLTHLGLDTGVEPASARSGIDDVARAALELDIRGDLDLEAQAAYGRFMDAFRTVARPELVNDF